MKTKHTPKKPARKDWHRADIKAALEKAGWSLRQLSFAYGYSSNMCIKALTYPYPNGERLIADAIGVEPWTIWPSRYDDAHQPIRHHANFPVKRPKNWACPSGNPRFQDTSPENSRNVNVEPGV